MPSNIQDSNSVSYDADSLNAIAENHERLQIITKERIIDELHKIIASDKPSAGFKLLENTKEHQENILCNMLSLRLIMAKFLQLMGTKRLTESKKGRYYLNYNKVPLLDKTIKLRN